MITSDVSESEWQMHTPGYEDFLHSEKDPQLNKVFIVVVGESSFDPLCRWLYDNVGGPSTTGWRNYGIPQTLKIPWYILHHIDRGRFEIRPIANKDHERIRESGRKTE